MTRRPDSQDHAQVRCDELSPPASGWRWKQWRLLSRADAVILYASLREHIDNIKKEVKKMGEATAAALAELNKDLHRLAEGYVALQAENAALKAALASADADKAAAVADAIAADDAVDSAAIAEADAIVEGLSPEPAPEPPAEG